MTLRYLSGSDDSKGRGTSANCSDNSRDVNAVIGRLNFRQQEPTHIMENIICNEVVSRGYTVDVGIVEIREGNDRKQIEIDFVANVNLIVEGCYIPPD